MPSLKDAICTPERRAAVVRDAAQLVEDEVSAKSGLSGIAIKTGFKAVKAVKPGLIPEVIDALLDEFVGQLEDLYAEWQEKGRAQGFDQFLVANKERAANALLGVTDRRADRTQHKTLKKTYHSLRPQGEKNVQAALPGLGRLMAKYLS